MGLATALGLRRLGFFIPYRYARGVADPARDHAYPELAKLFHAREETFLAVLAAISQFADDLKRIGSEPPPAPRWNQDWFPRLDAAAAYAFVRGHFPARIVEVGCGHSTRFLARALADSRHAATITVIDPGDGRRLGGLPVEWLRVAVQEAGLAPFAVLKPGDILSFDSSHILMPGTDVDVLVNRVLPMIPAGVLVHAHDIFLPDGYPAGWQWRGYNEQTGIAPLLQGGGYEILWSSRYVATRMAKALEGTVIETLPRVPGAFESSLWLRKRAT
ncbi:MAG: class I SAM-dependent methyltransferase [Rhodospirillales bacterium]|nr:class I SAM-dependent methyltransferase [Rhodospirillales bacterium]